MATEFSFGRLMRHLLGGEDLPRPSGLPTEEHMRAAIQGYIDNLNSPDSGYADRYLAMPRTGQDPVGTATLTFSGDPAQMLTEMKQLIDVPFVPQRAELTAPITFSLGNQAAMAFRLWAQVDGRNLTIDIIEVMTFDEAGKISNQMAYWGVDNVTLLD